MLSNTKKDVGLDFQHVGCMIVEETEDNMIVTEEQIQAMKDYLDNLKPTATIKS